jgi:cation diffusion facilitator family transporter|uniref:Cation transporter n=1 Tax=Desulfomonile tiedjei TaxID=2358 RepID=A0A7C4EYW8_9BACT
MEDKKELRLGNRSAMVLGLVLSIGLMGVKFLAYAITSSSAILSDALESIINVVAGLFALFSVWLSEKPPDETHPYGHGKIEYFSAGFEGALIVLAAVGIFFEGVSQFLTPRELPTLDKGLMLVFGAALVNLFVGLMLLRVGRNSGSLVLIADGKHILTDFYTSVGVVVGLILVHATGWFRVDGLVACLVGAHIVYSGSWLVRDAFGGLMNRSDPRLLEEICALLEAHRKPTWIDVHRLRLWRSGVKVHIDFHLILPRELSLSQAHKEVKELERIFEEHFQGKADVLIHLDPCEEPECPVCANEPCELRVEELSHQANWRRMWTECIKERASHNRSSKPEQRA